MTPPRETYTLATFERTSLLKPLTKQEVCDLTTAQVIERFRAYDRALFDKKAEVCKLREEVVLLKETLEVAVKNKISNILSGNIEPMDERMFNRNRPCGCVICICNDEVRCHGCGAKTCKDFPHSMNI